MTPGPLYPLNSIRLESPLDDFLTDLAATIFLFLAFFEWRRFVLCSILGMHLFGCKFCDPSLIGTKDCGRKNFDNLLWAIITVFQVRLSSASFNTVKC